MRAPLRSSRISGLNPSPNFTNSDISIFSMNIASSSDDMFFVFQRGTYENLTSTINLVSFQREHNGGVSMFQSTFDSAAQKRHPIYVDFFNIFSPKYPLREYVATFLNTDEPSALPHHLTCVLLNQMTSKAGIKKHGDKANEVLFT